MYNMILKYVNYNNQIAGTPDNFIAGVLAKFPFLQQVNSSIPFAAIMLDVEILFTIEEEEFHVRVKCSLHTKWNGFLPLLYVTFLDFTKYCETACIYYIDGYIKGPVNYWLNGEYKNGRDLSHLYVLDPTGGFLQKIGLL